MTYDLNCTGAVVIDKQNNLYGDWQPTVYSDEIHGQRFVPTSKCLESVTLRLRKTINEDVDIEICEDVSGLPSSNILYSYRIPYTTLQSSFSNINIPIKIELSNLNPLWILIKSRRYAPNYYDGIELFGIDAGPLSNDNIEYSSRKTGMDNWVTSTRKLYFQTYKKSESQQFHKACVNNICTQVPGAGTDECTVISSSCIPPKKDNTLLIAGVVAIIAVAAYHVIKK